MKIKLTPSRIKRLPVKSSEYTVWDSATPHLGIRIAPSGTMRFIHFVNRNGNVKRTTIGDAYSWLDLLILSGTTRQPRARSSKLSA